MRKKLWIWGLMLGLLCTACSGESGGRSAGESAEVWFVAVSNGETGTALGKESRSVTGEAGVEELMGFLLSAPESEKLKSPFPRGTVLRGWKLEGDLVQVDLSESYGGLSGVELSLADGCIVLTLCQLPEVERVYLTVEGKARPFRDQVMTAADFLLENGSGQERERTLRLWFPDGEGLRAEERDVELHIGDDPVIAAVQALLKGPEDGGLWAICPEETTVLSLTQQKDGYLLNVSGDWNEWDMEDSVRMQALEATVREFVPEANVELLVEGQKPREK